MANSYALVFSLYLILTCVLAEEATSPVNVSGSVFICDTTFYSRLAPAETINELKPSDVRVVAGMGDSWTSGFGILSSPAELLNTPLEYRGLVWSVGGDESLSYVTTLPNVLKKYSANLYGYSEGTTDPFLPLSDTRFNVGKVGAGAEDLLDQAQIVVERMKSDSNIAFEQDWKVLTVLVGYNDLCDYPCLNDSLGDPSVWIGNIRSALDYLFDNLPRTFVNLVQLGDLYTQQVMVGSHSQLGEVCQTTLRRLCRCGPYGVNFTSREDFMQVNYNYQQQLDNLVSSGRYSTDNFTVQIQRFLTNFSLPTDDRGELDLTVLAPDCAHLSGMGNRLLAIALWNNMFHPTDSKRTILDVDDLLFCPTEQRSTFSVIASEQNSSDAVQLPFRLMIMVTTVAALFWPIY